LVELVDLLLDDERTHPLVAKQNGEGDSPYTIALENGNSAMIELLRKRCPQHCPGDDVVTSLEHGVLLDA
jgi:hypothetical protein